MFGRALCLAVAVVLTGAGEALAQKQAAKEPQRERLCELQWRPLLCGLDRAAKVRLAEVAETEPNDDATSADAVSLGDQGTGEVNPAGDVDYWVFAVTAGTDLDIDVDAWQVGSPLDPTLELLDTDGTTRLAYNDDFDGLDSRIQYTIDVTGDYYIAIRAYANGGGPGETYTINFNSVEPGPGDPVTLIASGLSLPLGLAAGSDGDLYVAEAGMDRILRVTTAGDESVFATGITLPLSLAFDASGDLLVVSDYAVVYKVTPQGQVSTFLTDAVQPFWVTVGPEGDIWLSDLDSGTIRHYDQDGAFIESVDVLSVGGAGPIAFAPTGLLYFSTGGEMYRLVGGVPELVYTIDGFQWAFAFDVDGNIYSAEPNAGKMFLNDIDGGVLEDPFVTTMVAPVATAFGRDPDGMTNARLFATDIDGGTLVEVNPEGVLAPGWPVGAQLRDYTAYLDLDQIDAAPGEAFEVPLVLESNDGSDLPVAAYQSELNWQPSDLNYLANRAGDFGGAFVANDTDASQGVFGAAAARATDVGVPLTTLFWLTYELDPSLEPGQCADISIRFDELSGETGEDYLSKLAVETPVSIGLGEIQGDVTGDGVVSVADVVMILRSLVDLPICEGCDIGKGDADCDGDVDSADAVVILRSLVGLPVGDVCVGDPRIGPC